MSLSFRRSNGLVKIGDVALRTMLGFAQLSRTAAEAGGVLIGRHIIGGTDVVVDRVTGPMSGDRRSRTRFDRARWRHQRILDDEWEQSGGTSVYLGEWHTHPEPRPSPSQMDMDDWHKRLTRDRVEAEFLLFVIVGQIEVRAWEGSRASLGVTPLRPQKEPHLVRVE